MNDKFDEEKVVIRFGNFAVGGRNPIAERIAAIFLVIILIGGCLLGVYATLMWLLGG